ncbi:MULTISPECIES: hypothetical protein [unclassified Leifsonia]|uniref:hypothetical protein n=1 Tax=unclassified Leifsonia TaxID=2663824 RepID=UPI00087CC89C|nr:MULTISPECIES: hypothetical protein [unclassified Leifsonia]MDR6612748.1 hypothetical protein [Leifsonia sp. 1010]SDH26833.1 hypothetical protein SAMN04515690_1557 [Leifsonia sp. 197AMF]SDJ11788.1 hypothetical protein SAMN04515684_2227 [Leifsonia sp. 466MF]SDJ57923.1 hypothetical protein SAMN04515683_0518 [Leifsonia sp. 157MF]SDN33212.1 hypothetical protein SAMN04515686_0410 [Leifsonia sp. 509MF]
MSFLPEISSSTIADVLDDALRTASDAVETLTHVDQILHRAAVDLLNLALPTIVRAGSVPVQAAALAVVSASSGRIGLTLGGAAFSNTVLGGEVAKKVAQGIDTLKADSDYGKAVNSITW